MVLPNERHCCFFAPCAPARRGAILGSVQIIRAQPADAPILSSIAWAAKAHWGYPSNWMEQWRDQLTITPEFVAANETFAALVPGQMPAFYALLETAETQRLKHLWVLPERIGQGIGRSPFTHAVERATLRGARSLTIEAGPHAEPFYRHLGAVQIGMIASEIDGHHREVPLLVFDTDLPTKNGGSPKVAAARSF